MDHVSPGVFLHSRRRMDPDDLTSDLCVFYCGGMVLLWGMLCGVSARKVGRNRIPDLLFTLGVSWGVCQTGMGMEPWGNTGWGNGSAQYPDDAAFAQGNDAAGKSTGRT